MINQYGLEGLFSNESYEDKLNQTYTNFWSKNGLNHFEPQDYSDLFELRPLEACRGAENGVRDIKHFDSCFKKLSFERNMGKVLSESIDELSMSSNKTFKSQNHDVGEEHELELHQLSLHSPIIQELTNPSENRLSSNESRNGKILDEQLGLQNQNFKAKRKDVAVKSILRSMRKYYCDLLQKNTDFKRNIRNIKLKHKLLISCSIELAEELELGANIYVIAFYLACLAFPNDAKKIFKNSSKADSDNTCSYETGIMILKKIEDTLGRYSKKVLNEFMQSPEICLLLLHYLNKVEVKNCTSQYEMLENSAIESISGYENNKFDVKSSDKVEYKIIDMLK